MAANPLKLCAGYVVDTVTGVPAVGQVSPADERLTASEKLPAEVLWPYAEAMTYTVFVEAVVFT